MDFSYTPSGVCSRKVNFSLDEDGTISNVSFVGGCNGNLKGISSLLEGMNVDDVISRISGTTCGMKRTSCPDQLARALTDAKTHLGNQ